MCSHNPPLRLDVSITVRPIDLFTSIPMHDAIIISVPNTLHSGRRKGYWYASKG